MKRLYLTSSMIACTAVLLLGCHGTRQVTTLLPQVPMPDDWAMQAEKDGQTPDVTWWQHFGSDELTSLVLQAREHNLDIAAAISRMRQAEVQARIAGVPLLPNAQVVMSSSRDIALSKGSSTTNASGMLEVSYEIDFWGKNEATHRAAASALRANVYDQQTVQLTVTSGVVSTYLQVLSLKDRLEIARENVASAERVLKLVDAQYRAGAASTLDLARQRSAVAGQQAVIPSLVEQEREARSALAILLGRIPQSFDVTTQGLHDISMPKVSPGLPSELLVRRPDIRRAESLLMEADANVIVARASLFPSIVLTGATGVQSSALLSLFNGPSFVANVGMSVIAPIFNAGKLRNQRELAEARKEELVFQYRSTVMKALSEVSKALGLIHSLEEQYKLKSMEVEQAKSAFNLSEVRYRMGAEDLMTMLDTQRSYTNARNELGQIKLQRLQATVSLYKALGGGWQDGGSLQSQE